MAPLNAITQIALGRPPEGPASKMAATLLSDDEVSQENAWGQLAAFIETPVTLKAIRAANREERASLLQHALRKSTLLVDESRAAACAFIATQVAPGSLEHLELLRNAADPSVSAWYSLYAALQSPKEILSGQGGFGVRLLRDMARAEGHIDRPSADLAYRELKALERIGIDAVSRRLGHVGEIEVELLPFVTSSFTYQAKAGRPRVEQHQLSFEADQPTLPAAAEISTKARISQLLSNLSALVQELPDPNSEPSTLRRGRRRQQ
ncbi:hypothetical protein Tamer19_47490 [Cupriavidus sp. TA19]|nr:hypothetical protein Tamer19_47490 [Cupriavidus sp. TA19]